MIEVAQIVFISLYLITLLFTMSIRTRYCPTFFKNAYCDLFHDHNYKEMGAFLCVIPLCIIPFSLLWEITLPITLISLAVIYMRYQDV